MNDSRNTQRDEDAGESISLETTWAENIPEDVLIILPVRNTVVFPGAVVPLTIGRKISLHGFTAFIPWTYQPGNTELGGKQASAVEYLKTLALSRIVLDNVPNVQASWVTQGAKVAQVALEFGANDFGSTMIEENVVAAAGVSFRMSRQEIVRLIQDAGYAAAQRDTTYHILKREPASP